MIDKIYLCGIPAVFKTMAARGLVNGRGPRSGRGSLEYFASFLQLSDELHRLLDKRMHIYVLVYKRNHLAIASENLLDAP